jgi:hypothetical protein
MAECPAEDFWRCRCKCQDIIVGRHTAYYPGMQLFREGRKLLRVSPGDAMAGWHRWHATVHLPEKEPYRAALIITPRHLLFKCNMPDRIGIAYCLDPFVGHKALFLMPQLWCIQRNVRRFLARRRWMAQAKLMVLTSAVLGGPLNSPLLALPLELLGQCLRYL